MPYSNNYTTCLLLASCLTGVLLGQIYHIIIASFIILVPVCISCLKRKTPKTPDRTAFEYRFHRRRNPVCNTCPGRMAASGSHKLELTFAKAGLRTLQGAGMRSINFAGEEPLLEPGYLGELARYCKEVLGLERTLISTNGALLVKEDWLRKYREYIDVLRFSYRSSGAPPQELARLCRLCEEHGVRFELYTAVDDLNCDEDMNLAVQSISPHRWVVHKFQAGDGANGQKNAVRRGVATDEQFERFCARHATREGENAYFESLPGEEELWLDEHMRFVNRQSEQPTHSVLDVGVVAALAELSEAALGA